MFVFYEFLVKSMSDGWWNLTEEAEVYEKLDGKLFGSWLRVKIPLSVD